MKNVRFDENIYNPIQSKTIYTRIGIKCLNNHLVIDFSRVRIFNNQNSNGNR